MPSSENENHTDSNHTDNHNDSSLNHTFSIKTDISNSIIIDASSHRFFDMCGNSLYDLSGNLVFDISDNILIPHLSNIVTDISDIIINGIGYQIENQQGLSSDGSSIIRTIFTSTQPDIYDPNITENFTQQVEIYNDELDPNSPNEILLNQIRSYASEIQCSDFHGKGTIDDYTALFQAASKIANESKQIELDIDVEGFSEFAQAADDLSSLFTSFITKLQNVNIINDTTFLTAISTALKKIVNLSKIFGKFKETILTTTTIQFPKSAHDTTEILKDVMDEINCAMGYIEYFVNPGDISLNDAELSSVEKNIISQSINTIDSWNILCEQGVSIAMANNSDVQYIQQASNELKNTTHTLQNATSNLKQKLKSLNISI